MQKVQGKPADALITYRAGLVTREHLAASDAGNVDGQRDLSVSNERLGDILLAQCNLPAALEQYRARLDRMVLIRDRDPSNADLQRFTSVTFNKIGDVLVKQGKLADALTSYRAGLVIAERLAASDAGNADWQRDVAVSYAKLATVHRQSGDNAEARGFLRQGPRNRVALDKTLSGQCRVETRPRLVRPRSWRRSVAVTPALIPRACGAEIPIYRSAAEKRI